MDEVKYIDFVNAAVTPSCVWGSSWLFKKTMHFLCLPLDASLNISASHFTGTPSTFEVILQLTWYTNYLLTYLLDDYLILCLPVLLLPVIGCFR